MANKKLPSSTGYFNKEMQSILKKGEVKKSKKQSTSKNNTKNNKP